MTMTPVEFAHLYLYGDKDKFQDPKTWPLGPSYGHWDQCKRLVALVEARDREQIEMLARLIQEKEALAAENLQLRAQLDPDGPALPLLPLQPMQAGTGPGFAKSVMAVVTAAGSTSADVIAELQAEVKLLEVQKAELHRLLEITPADMPLVAMGGAAEVAVLKHGVNHGTQMIRRAYELFEIVAGEERPANKAEFRVFILGARQWMKDA